MAERRDEIGIVADDRVGADLADQLDIESIAFPLVSAGIYGWPLDDAAACAVDTLRTTPTRVKSCLFVAFGRASYQALQTALGSTPA